MADFARFAEDNIKWKALRKRVPWNERVKMIDDEFPGMRDADWNIILRDHDIFGRILKDVLKVDQIQAGRPGPRPNLETERGMQTWREVNGDYSELPFAEAFRVLTRNHSVRAIARRTSLAKSRVDRLRQGTIQPDINDLRAIAAGYKKKPAYFVEYRAEYIVAAIATRLHNEHELTVAIYRKLVQQ